MLDIAGLALRLLMLCDVTLPLHVFYLRGMRLVVGAIQERARRKSVA